MMNQVTLYAQPYDPSASGFVFHTLEDFQRKADQTRNDLGFPVEEFDIQLVDADSPDAELFKALSVNQYNMSLYLSICENWDDDDKVKAIVAVGECGYTLEDDDPSSLPEVDLYKGMTLEDLACEFVDEGLYGKVPDALVYYIDYSAIASDLRFDYSTVYVGGQSYTYRCD